MRRGALRIGFDMRLYFFVELAIARKAGAGHDKELAQLLETFVRLLCEQSRIEESEAMAKWARAIN